MIDYRVVPVTRYIITRYEEGAHCAQSSTKGEYDNAKVAYEVAYALCKAEHEAAGSDIGSMDFSYPVVPGEYADEKIQSMAG